MEETRSSSPDNNRRLFRCVLRAGNREDILLRQSQLERQDIRGGIKAEQFAVGNQRFGARGGHQSGDRLFQLRALLRDLLQVLGARPRPRSLHRQDGSHETQRSR